MDLEISNILSAIIGALGTITAAVLAMVSARRIVKKEIRPLFSTYSDKDHDVRSLLEKAKRNIVVVVSIGDILLEKHGDIIQRKLQSGVHVYYLLQRDPALSSMEEYLHGPNYDKKGYASKCYQEIISMFQNWHADGVDVDSNGHNYLHVREFNNFLSASYIGIDIATPFSNIKLDTSHSVIQVMQYQYRVAPKDSPIVPFLPERDKKQYESTKHSINIMWEAAYNIPLYS